MKKSLEMIQIKYEKNYKSNQIKTNQIQLRKTSIVVGGHP